MVESADVCENSHRVYENMVNKAEKQVMSGIYSIRSESMKIIWFGVSVDVSGRVRKMRSDYGLGRRDKIFAKIGLGFAGDVEIRTESYCEDGEYQERIMVGCREYANLGYAVHGMFMETVAKDGVVRGEDGARIGEYPEVEELVVKILGLGMKYKDLLRLLDTQVEYLTEKKVEI